MGGGGERKEEVKGKIWDREEFDGLRDGDIGRGDNSIRAVLLSHTNGVNRLIGEILLRFCTLRSLQLILQLGVLCFQLPHLPLQFHKFLERWVVVFFQTI